jgi:hypothetical protein
MKRKDRSLIVAMLLSIIVLATGSVQAGGPQVKSEDAAVASARIWLGMVDAGKYGEAWDKSAGYFKNAVPKDNFTVSLEGVREPLGRTVKRSLL